MSIKTFTFPSATLSDRRRVSSCHNLRLSDDARLHAVGRPKTITRFGGKPPLTVAGGNFTLSDGSRCLIIHHDGKLKAAVGDSGVTCALTLMDSRPECVIPIDDGFIVMPGRDDPGSEARCFVFSRAEDDSGCWSESPLFHKLPPLMIARRDVGQVNVSTSGLTLKASYSTTTQHLNQTDQAAVDKALREAYIRMSDSALSKGRYIQPVMARYRLIGENGRTLYTSAPVIVAPKSGLQGIETSLVLSGDGFRSCSPATLSATEFIPEIEYPFTPDALWNKLVRRVELQVSPQIHPYSSSLPGYTSKSTSTATQLKLFASLPGMAPFGDPAENGTRTASLIASMLDNADNILLPDNIAPDTDTELKTLRSISSMRHPSLSDDTAMSVNLVAPHRFTAQAVARSGDLIAWGNLTAHRFDGYTLAEMATAATVSAAATPTAVKVAMHDGSSVVNTCVINSRADPIMSPLVAYPSGDAVEMTLHAASRSHTLPLCSTPAGRFAFYLNPSLQPFTLADERGGFVVPSASNKPLHYPSALAVCQVSSPFDPVTACCGDGSAIHTILPSMRHSNSFTVPSARFYIFSPAGISSMTLTDNRRRINLNLLDSRGVKDRHAVTPTSTGIAAIAGGALVTVTGSRPLTLLDRCDCSSLGWCGRFGELWCVPGPGDEPAMIISLDGRKFYTRAVADISEIISTGNGMVIVSKSGELLDPNTEMDGSPVEIIHESTINHGFKPGATAAMTAHIFGEALDGSVTLSLSNGAPERCRAILRKLTIKGGDLNHPLYEPVLIPHSHCLKLKVRLTTDKPSKLTIS